MTLSLEPPQQEKKHWKPFSILQAFLAHENNAWMMRRRDVNVETAIAGVIAAQSYCKDRIGMRTGSKCVAR